MFERRLKVFLGILVGVTVIVALRAAQLQVVNGSALPRGGSAEHGAGDAGGHGAGADPGPEGAGRRGGPAVHRCGGGLPRDRAEPGLDQGAGGWRGWGRRIGRRSRRRSARRCSTRRSCGCTRTSTAMWRELAEVSGKSADDIAAIKNAIHFRVDLRRRYLWYKKYAAEVELEKVKEGQEQPWYREWGIVRSSEPQIDAFETEVAEQEEAHVVLNNVSPEVHNRLRKQSERFPGLVMRPSKHRYYPYRSAASHVLGTLSGVTPEDLKNDPNFGDELRQYLPERPDRPDAAWRRSASRRCAGSAGGSSASWAGEEPAARGRSRAGQGREAHDRHRAPDADRGDVQDRSSVRRGDGQAVDEVHEMHGAAVVIDVPTGEVRALVSYPTFDLNMFDEQYSEAGDGRANKPLLNRATQCASRAGVDGEADRRAGGRRRGVDRRARRRSSAPGSWSSTAADHEHGRCWTASHVRAQTSTDPGGAPPTAVAARRTRTGS